MNFKALALTLALGVIAVVAPACSGCASKCSPANCTGCCDGTNKCSSGDTNAACGTQGLACTACTGSDSCNAHVCSAGTGGGDGGTCGCPNGCCNANNDCVLGTQSSNCGSGGAACVVCNTAVGESCQAQACATGGPGTGITGKACATDADCSTLPNGVCRLHTAISGAGTYPQGYCTAACGSQVGGCPGDAICIQYTPFDDEPSALCSAKCTATAGSVTQGSCRAGYLCFGVSGNGLPAGPGICWLDSRTFDWGTPPTRLGQSCSADSDCEGTTKDGICFPQQPDGGFPGGFCSTLTCGSNVSVDHCGDGGTCELVDIGLGNNSFPSCFANCKFDGGRGDCRSPGYTCSDYTYPDGGPSTVVGAGTCLPKLDGGL